MAKRSLSSSIVLKLLVLALYASVFFFLMNSAWDMAWFALGVACAAGAVIADELILYHWYQEPGKPQFLVTRSPLFLLSLIPLSVMVLTSFGSLWASGLVGGMTLFLLLEMIERRHDVPAFRARFLHGVKDEVSPNSITMILLGGSIFFLFIHLLAIL